jgi:hypothetical protein
MIFSTNTHWRPVTRLMEWRDSDYADSLDMPCGHKLWPTIHWDVDLKIEEDLATRN